MRREAGAPDRLSENFESGLTSGWFPRSAQPEALCELASPRRTVRHAFKRSTPRWAQGVRSPSPGGGRRAATSASASLRMFLKLGGNLQTAPRAMENDKPCAWPGPWYLNRPRSGECVFRWRHVTASVVLGRRDRYCRLRGLSASRPRRRGDPSPRIGRVAAAASQRQRRTAGVVISREVAEPPHGISTRPPRRRRGPASEYLRGARGVAAARRASVSARTFVRVLADDDDLDVRERARVERGELLLVRRVDRLGAALLGHKLGEVVEVGLGGFLRERLAPGLVREGFEERERALALGVLFVGGGALRGVRRRRGRRGGLRLLRRGLEERRDRRLLARRLGLACAGSPSRPSELERSRWIVPWASRNDKLAASWIISSKLAAAATRIVCERKIERLVAFDLRLPSEYPRCAPRRRRDQPRQDRGPGPSGEPVVFTSRGAAALRDAPHHLTVSATTEPPRRRAERSKRAGAVRRPPRS